MHKTITASIVGLILSLTMLSPVFAYSHASFDQLLKTYVVEGQVDYETLQAQRAPLDAYVASLNEVTEAEYSSWSENDKVAFWINAYNAITLKVLIDYLPIKKKLFPTGLVFPKDSIQQIPGKWDKITHPVMGEPMTLDHIEHEILRKDFNQPYIHMALVCGAKGCPPLRSEAFVGDRLIAQFEDQTRAFLSEDIKFKIDQEAGVVGLSPILKWFGGDFVETYKPASGYGTHSDVERSVLSFVAQFVSPDEAVFLATGDYKIKYLGYDWGLNRQ